jgi:hypothetical protein
MLFPCEFRELLRRAALLVLCLMLCTVLLQAAHVHNSPGLHSDCPACIASHHTATAAQFSLRMPELARTNEEPETIVSLLCMQVNSRHLFIRPPPAVV